MATEPSTSTTADEPSARGAVVTSNDVPSTRVAKWSVCTMKGRFASFATSK